MPTFSNSQHSSITLFLDRTHQSKVAAKLLRELDINVEVHKRHYLPAAPDPEWIADATRQGWAIISGDKGLQLDGINRHAVAQAKAKVFLLTDTESRGAEWAASLVTARNKIIRVATGNNGPFYCTVDKGNDHHVRTPPEFLDGGGPIEKSPDVISAAVTSPTAEPTSEPTPVHQTGFDFETK